MPVVPRYDSLSTAPAVSQGDINPGDTSGASQVARQQLGGLGEALSNAGGALGNIALDMAKRENTTAVFKAEALLTDTAQQMHADVMNRQGENAKGASKFAQQWWDEAPAKLIDGLSNDAQKEAFGRIVAQKRIASIGTATEHEFKQVRIAEAQAADASIKNSISTIAADALNGKTPDTQGSAAQVEYQRMLSTFEALAASQGMGADAKANARLMITTQANKEIIQGLADKDPDAAKAWFYGHKKEIDGVQHAELEKALEASGMDVKRQHAIDYMSAQGFDVDRGLDYIKANFTGKERDQIESGWMAENARREQAKNLKEQKIYEPIQLALGDAEAGRRLISNKEQSALLSSLRSQSPEMYDKAAGEIAQHNNRIRAEWRANESHMRAMAASSPDKAINAVNLEIDMYRNPDKYKNAEQFQTFIGQALRENKITPAEAGQAVTRWKDINDPKKAADASWFKLTDDELEAAAWKSGVLPRGTPFAKANEDQQNNYMAFRIGLLSRINDFEATQLQGKRKASQQEIKTITDSYLIDKVYTPGRVYGENQYQISQVPEKNLRDAYVRVGDKTVKLNEIPPDARAEAVQYMRRRGIPVTQQGIAELWVRFNNTQKPRNAK